MRRTILPLIPLVALSVTAPLRAQDAAPAASDAGAVSFFTAFFWPANDVVGLVIIWALVVASMASIGYAITLLVQYRRATMMPPEVTRRLERSIAEKRYREAIEATRTDRSFLAAVVSAALEESPHGHGAMERAIEEVADVEVSRIMRPIELLNVLGNIAPMLGLFGTVYGMIVAFQQLVAAGGRPDAAALAGGISTALVTTFWGLVVAIPALAAYALIRNRIDALTSEGVVLAETIISPFKPGGKKRKARPESVAAAGESTGLSATRPRATPQPRVEAVDADDEDAR